MVLPLNIVDIHNRLLTLGDSKSYNPVENIPPLNYTEVNSSKLAVTVDGELFNLAKRAICTLVDYDAVCARLEYDTVPRFERVIDMPADAVLVIAEPLSDGRRLIVQIDHCSVLDELNQYQWHNLGEFNHELLTSISDTICNDRIPEKMRANVEKIRTDLIFTNDYIYSVNGDYWKENPICARNEVIDMISYRHLSDGAIRYIGALALMKDGTISYDLNHRQSSVHSLNRWRGRCMAVINNPENWRFIELGRQRALANSATGEVRLIHDLAEFKVLDLPFDSFRLASSRSKSSRNVGLIES